MAEKRRNLGSYPPAPPGAPPGPSISQISCPRSRGETWPEWAADQKIGKRRQSSTLRRYLQCVWRGVGTRVFVPLCTGTTHPMLSHICPSPEGLRHPAGSLWHLHLSSNPFSVTLPACFPSKFLRAEHKIPSVPLVRESKEELLLLLARLGFVELPQSSVYHAIELEAHA